MDLELLNELRALAEEDPVGFLKLYVTFKDPALDQVRAERQNKCMWCSDHWEGGGSCLRCELKHYGG